MFVGDVAPALRWRGNGVLGATTPESSLQTEVLWNQYFNLVNFGSGLAYFQELDPPFHGSGARRSRHFLWYSA